MGAVSEGWMCMAAVSRQEPPDPRQTDLAGLVKRVWLLLYTEGGHWTASELRTRLNVDKNLQAVQSALGEMARRGFIVRYRRQNIDGETSIEYGVTSKCKLPRGVMLEEIEELLQMSVRRV